MKTKKRLIATILIGLILVSSSISATATETVITDIADNRPATIDEISKPTDDAPTEAPTETIITATEPTATEHTDEKADIEPTAPTENTENKTDTEKGTEANLSELYVDTTPYIKQGDVNGDGEINDDDVAVILRYLAGDTENVENDMILRGDVNGDKVTDIIDASLIQQYIAGNISLFDMISRMEDMPLYLQYKEPWGSFPYGDGTIADSGCGPTSIAMTASYLTGSQITPENVAAYLSSKENGGRYSHYLPGIGMTHDVWELCARHYGFIYVAKANGIDEAYKALRNGQVVICSQSAGIFTMNGHFIVLSGLWNDGTIRVNDPNDNEINKNYKNIHFTKEAIAQSGNCYYVFDSYDTQSTPQSEEEFVKLFNGYFSRLGYSKAAICGILGNIYVECSMNPDSYFAQYIQDAGGAPGNSNGICQWYGDNCNRFRRDCPNWNTNVMAQFKYLAKTLENDGNGTGKDQYYYGCSGCKDTLDGNITDRNKKWIEQYGKVTNTKEGAKVAARAFMDLYERPNMSFDQSIRWFKAEQYWDMIQ